MNVWTGIKRFFAPPVFKDDEEKTRNAAILNTLLWFSFWAILLAAPGLVSAPTELGDKIGTGLLVGAFILSIVGLIWMIRQGRVRRASVLLVALIWAVVTVSDAVFAGLRSTVTSAYLVAIFMAGFLLGWTAALITCLTTAVAVTILVLCEYYGVSIGGYTIPVNPILGGTSAGLDDLFMVFAIIAATAVVVGLSHRSIVSSLKRARANEHELAEANRELRVRSDELQVRTRDLGRRSMQLQIVAEISRDVAAVREMDKLFNQAARLIQERLSFYHVSIFLIDEQGECAVLQAAAGAGGHEMSGSEMPLDDESLISYVIKSGYHRVLLDVGDEAVKFENPLLPGTRSEAALPLRVGRYIVGALDIHSQQEAAFDADDVMVLQTMADQLAVAIESARLLEETQQAMRQLEVASGHYTQDSWRMAIQRGRQGLGYRYRRVGVDTVTEPSSLAQQVWSTGQPVVTHQAEMADDEPGSISTLTVPVKLRDQVVGVVDVNFEEQSVSPDTLSLVEEIAGRLALALENARLLDETRRRALRDRLIATITSQVRASMDVERILQTAVRGLGAALGSDRAFIRLGGSAQPSEERRSDEQEENK